MRKGAVALEISSLFSAPLLNTLCLTAKIINKIIKYDFYPKVNDKECKIFHVFESTKRRAVGKKKFNEEFPVHQEQTRH